MVGERRDERLRDVELHEVQVDADAEVVEHPPELGVLAFDRVRLRGVLLAERGRTCDSSASPRAGLYPGAAVPRSIR